MARLGRLGFLSIAVVFHLVYIYSIFDIYFVSPIVHGMKAYRVEAPKAPAKRLVLYVGTKTKPNPLGKTHKAVEWLLVLLPYSLQLIICY